MCELENAPFLLFPSIERAVIEKVELWHLFVSEPRMDAFCFIIILTSTYILIKIIMQIVSSSMQNVHLYELFVLESCTRLLLNDSAKIRMT